MMQSHRNHVRFKTRARGVHVKKILFCDRIRRKSSRRSDLHRPQIVFDCENLIEYAMQAPLKVCVCVCVYSCVCVCVWAKTLSDIVAVPTSKGLQDSDHESNMQKCVKCARQGRGEVLALSLDIWLQLAGAVLQRERHGLHKNTTQCGLGVSVT